MPIALKAGKRFPLVLKIDESEPEDKRPTFWFRYLNGSEWMDLVDVTESVPKSTGGREARRKVSDALRRGLIGWDHMIAPVKDEAIAFDGKQLERLINP